MRHLDFGTVKRSVDAADPIGLLADGAPPNEYDNVSRILLRGINSMIDSGRLGTESDAATIQRWARYVFTKRFSTGRLEWFEGMAHELAELCR